MTGEARGVVVLARSNLLAEALAHLLTSRGLAAAPATVAALDGEPPPPAVAVVELDPADPAVYETLAELRRRSPQLRLVALVAPARWLHGRLAEGVHPDAWLTPASAPGALVAAVEPLARGLPAPRWMRTPPRPLRHAVPSGVTRLTPRELEVLRALGTGADVAAIGSQLQISEHTVRTHLRNLRGKLVVRTTLEVATLARRLWADEAHPL